MKGLYLKICFILGFILCLCVVYFAYNFKEQNFEKRGLCDTFEKTIDNIDMSDYIPEQTIKITYNLSVKYSLTSLCWCGFVSNKDFDQFIKQTAKAKKSSEYIDLFFYDKLGIKNITDKRDVSIFFIGKAIIWYDRKSQIVYGQYTSK